MAKHKVEEEVADYLSGLRLANSEEAKKLRFQNLLTRLFQDSQAAKDVVNQLAQGGEKTIFNIPRPGVPKTGYADIAYSNVIIEWEKDLAKTGKHAEDQLAEYLAGRWHSGDRYDYVLIATDGRIWRTYAPDLDVLLGQATPNRAGLRKVEDFEVKKDKEDKFFFFLDRVLFRSTRQRATLDAIQLDFGDTSRIFINAVQAMQRVMPATESTSVVHVAFEQWQRFLQLAYGKFDQGNSVYLVHTYLSVFAKLLAYAVLKPAARPSDDELKAILSGEAFTALNVANLVEGDFFYWVSSPEFFQQLAPTLRELYNQICEYDFTDVEEDILKGVYQELIDIDTRHALGEYYTPDWLCERVVDDLHLERDFYALDPACGSGSFLRALVARYRREWPDMPPQQIANQIKGVDVHPLSVQIAKTTMLLALGDGVARARAPVVLNVYLANTLFLSSDEAKKSLFTSGHHFSVRVDDKRLGLDMGPFIGQPDSFAKAIDLAQHFIDDQLKVEQTLASFEHALRNRVPDVTLAVQNVGELYAVYRAMRDAKLNNRDSIWRFVLQNLYQPVFMHRMFDVIVANPPWLTYADITSGDYQADVRALAAYYGLMPASKANNPHIDLSAVFLSHCGKYLAKDGAQLAFVLPRSFLSADQHQNARSGEARGFKLTEVWDLKGVSPLFNVPACVLMATASHAEGVESQRQRALPRNGLVGRVLHGKLPRPHMHWSDAQTFIKEDNTRWYFQELGNAQSKKKRSALVEKKLQGGSGGNAYAPRFRQGATIVPRAFYFVQPQGASLDGVTDLADRVVNLRTHPLAVEGAKKPWDGISISGGMQGKYLFRTALARNVLPFALVNPPLVALPLVKEDDVDASGQPLPGRLHWRLLQAAELTARGDLEAARWFGQCERLWEERRSDSAKKQKSSMTDWLDWQRKLTGQPVDAKWAVMYTASASDACACVLDVSSFSPRFMVDYTMYVCFTQTEIEARFVEAFLNSGYANSRIKEFQARGLFGPRHVSKKILDVSWPDFSPNRASHRQLVALSHSAAQAVQKILGSQQDLELDPRTLGRLRSSIRRELAGVMGQIDALVESISTGGDLLESGVGWEQLLRADRPVLAGADSAELSAFLRKEREGWHIRDAADGAGK
ncbi:N-6 DNA methylase [Polaromonas sp.]|uniref:N-6 DNA methylase n=1 Tax=Polaromonas sp. TaxID=1869339 RepID=UPI002733D1D0|nr:N-6 DNA methylase [Polaromonas sp.]